MFNLITVVEQRGHYAHEVGPTTRHYLSFGVISEPEWKQTLANESS